MVPSHEHGDKGSPREWDPANGNLIQVKWRAPATGLAFRHGLRMLRAPRMWYFASPNKDKRLGGTAEVCKELSHLDPLVNSKLSICFLVSQSWILSASVLFLVNVRASNEYHNVVTWQNQRICVFTSGSCVRVLGERWWRRLQTKLGRKTTRILQILPDRSW